MPVDLRKLYEEFTEADRRFALASFKDVNMSQREIEYIWRSLYQIDENTFQEILYLIQRSKDIEGLISISRFGLDLPLRALAILRRYGILELTQKGKLELEPFFATRERGDLESLFRYVLYPNQRYGQYPVTWRTSIRRARKIVSECPLENKKVLFLGDDDLTSVALAMMTKDAEIHVIDIAPNVIDRINEMNSTRHLDIRVHKHDLRKRLPNNLKRKFDLFSCDPYDSSEGIVLWLRRSIEALKREDGNRGYISLNPIRLGRKSYYFQKHLLNLGFEIMEIATNFNEYPIILEFNLANFNSFRFFWREIGHYVWNHFKNRVSYTHLFVVRYLNVDRKKRDLPNGEILRWV